MKTALATPVRMLVLVLVVVLVAACSGDDGSPSGGPTPGPATATGTSAAAPSDPARPPRPRLRAAQLALTRAAGGAYTLRIDTAFTEASISERGLFDVGAEVVNLRRTIKLGPGDQGRRLVMRIRSSPRTRFLQMSDWGLWDGCWAEFDEGLLAEQGIDLRGLPNIPVPVSMVLDARVSPENITPTSGPMVDKATVLTDAFSAMQLLGVDGSTLVDLPRALARVEVPAHLVYFADHPDVVQTIELYGNEVAEGLRASDAQVPEDLRTLLRQRDATTTFSPAPGPVTFTRPPARQLLPPGASEDQTCAAHPGPGGPAQV